MKRQKLRVSPADASPFRCVTQAIRRKGRPEGWAIARDKILDEFPVFQAELGTYQTLKAALEIDRHAMFAEVQAATAQGQFKHEVWERFQAFLQGDIAEPPMVVRGRSRIDSDNVDDLGVHSDSAEED